MIARKLAAVSLVLALLFSAAGLMTGQQSKGEEKEDKKQEGEGKEDSAKDSPADDAPLKNDDFTVFMDGEIKAAWNRLSINHRRKMADRAAEAADELIKLSAKVLRYDGEVLKGDNKGKKAREQADFKGWVADMKKHAETYAKHARGGDWDKATTARTDIDKACKACHDAYEE